MQKWRTGVSTHVSGDLYVRGYKLTDLIGKVSFTEAIFLVLRGKLPKKNELKLLDAIFVATIEHGVEVPSAFVARTVASTGNAANAALAAGILAIGEWHGGAIEGAAKMLQSEDAPEAIVKDFLKRKERLPGYGHKIYRGEDPRATLLIRRAKNLKLAGKYVQRAYGIEQELAEQSAKKLPLNIDGAVAALILELGFDWRLGKSFFILGRLPGLIAHVDEEVRNEKPYRRLDGGDVEYTGPALKKGKR